MVQEIGVLFDWDGVVVDSSKPHEESWERLAKEESLHLPEDHFLKGFGRKNEWIIPNILSWTEDKEEIHRLSLRKEYLYREILKETGLEALSGVRDLLQGLLEAKIPCIVATSSHRENIELALELLNFKNFFQDIISSENVSMGKPDPEVFIKAAERIGVDREKCVVFEDSYAGIQAARAGGMWVAGVATTNLLKELQEADFPPDIAVQSLEDVSAESVQSWIASRLPQGKSRC